MKNYVKAGSLAVLCLLCSCAQTAQGKLRQAVYDTASAYHLLASPMPYIMAGHVPGVSLSAGQKALARKASQSVLDELSALEQSIQAGNTLAETAVAALQADFAAFSTCWSGLTAGNTPAACTLAKTASTATTATQADAAVSVSTKGKE
ncbi:hypothetical protein GOB83_07775 [Acetobacter fabarum]|uniref:hypothetical protein n=1 Tax=Acetobacter fabarum TaxID=483199 RepID=UPI00140558CE|nr:hypothetical protein [Acetobacter fabarum]NHO42084.1 hypothetical protein [Acetobacter fabarum]GBQ33005.1 hypothetical protein AA19596_1059 [Acetobacter fabarum DSM 19596]